MSNLDVINAFLEAINANDKDRIMSFFTEDSVFDNVPMGPVTGLAAIWEVLAMVHDIATGVDWKIHRLEQGPSGTVYSERTDRYEINGQWAEFRCAGIHEIDANGKIVLWRDYFDKEQGLATMPR
ncbi:MAG: SnoaL-like domain-containing protein [Halieaceae bacterium]|jgi:limonene-1,2-epoxide hydrolase|nr:SnoaL-like domain-containing protein [Halieaceae bacterium]